RLLRRRLDDRAVHHRIGERDADLDGVRARRGDRLHHLRPFLREPSGDVGNEQLAPVVTSRAQSRFEAHARRSATCAASLSPRPAGTPRATEAPGCPLSSPRPAASTPTSAERASRNPAKVPIALEPPPTHATT